MLRTFTIMIVAVAWMFGDARAARAVQWNAAEYVFTGTLTTVQAGPVGRSFPPMYTHKLHFKVQDVLRGDLEQSAELIGSHVARQHQPPAYPQDKLCLVAASKARGSIRIDRIEQATPELVAQVRLACSLPLGWKLADDQPLSPWANLQGYSWPNDAKSATDVQCVRTGRPAYLAPSGITLEVTPMPPAKEIKWQNPDGDGQYKITVTNTLDEAVTVAALLADGEDILWNESLVILCQQKAYTIPGTKAVPSTVQPQTLAPGQSVSTVVNALALDGPEWPRGGYRIEFQFCLGQLSQTQSFYYYSKHHDTIRKAQ